MSHFAFGACRARPAHPPPTRHTPRAVSPIAIRARLPMVISHNITNLHPDFFWLGGGEVDLKVRAGMHIGTTCRRIM